MNTPEEMWLAFIRQAVPETAAEPDSVQYHCMRTAYMVAMLSLLTTLRETQPTPDEIAEFVLRIFAELNELGAQAEARELRDQ